ncbi:MAG: hypothetical protein JWO94_2880 [Verrucomicrobiaceae bacterium]|nr:hypothetical protein [Verrucomicrobiaceae bacterium]
MTKLLLLTLIVACLTSCPETTVPRHFGVKPAVLKASEWNGTWASPGSTGDNVHLAVDPSDPGALIVTEPSKQEKKDGPFKIYVWHQSADKDSHLYFFSIFDKPGKDTGSLSLLSQTEPNLLYLWAPKHEAITKAVKDGRLKGTLEKDKEDTLTTLAADPANYKVLGSPEFWEWTHPSSSLKQDKTKGSR